MKWIAAMLCLLAAGCGPTHVQVEHYVLTHPCEEHLLYRCEVQRAHEAAVKRERIEQEYSEEEQELK